jgi:hypothetical protein
MQRFNKYKCITKSNVELVVNQNDLPVVFPEPGSQPGCHKCLKDATHLASMMGRESYYCPAHAAHFTDTYKGADTDYYFCKTFQEVHNTIDIVKLHKKVNLTRDMANQCFRTVHKTYGEEEYKKYSEDQPVVWFLQIDGCICCGFEVSYLTMNIETLYNELEKDTSDEERRKSIELGYEKWKSGDLFVIFLDEARDVIFSEYLPKE